MMVGAVESIVAAFFPLLRPQKASYPHPVAENVVDTHTDRQTETQTKYRNPRCACAPRVSVVNGSAVR